MAQSRAKLRQNEKRKREVIRKFKWYNSGIQAVVPGQSHIYGPLLSAAENEISAVLSLLGKLQKGILYLDLRGNTVYISKCLLI